MSTKKAKITKEEYAFRPNLMEIWEPIRHIEARQISFGISVKGYTILKRRIPLKGHPDYGIMWDGHDIVTDTPIYLRLHEIKWNPGESVETRNSGSC